MCCNHSAEQSKHQGFTWDCMVCTMPSVQLLFVIAQISATPVKSDPLFCAKSKSARGPVFESQLCLKGQLGIPKYK